MEPIRVRLSEVVEKATLSPNAAIKTVAAASLKVEWPDTYSGCAGVTRNGVQSAAVLNADESQ